MADFIDDSTVTVRSFFVPLVFCTVNLILVILVTCAKKKLPPTAATVTPVPTEPTNIVEAAPDTSTATAVDQSQAQTTFVAPEITQPQEASDSAASLRPAAPIVDSVKTTRSRLQRTKSPPRGKITNSTARQTYTKDLDVERCLPEDSALIDRPFSKDRLTSESVTEEIRVPIGKTATSPVPQSSLTHRKNLKDIGNPRPEPSSVKFGEERISTTRSQPAAND